MDIAYIDILAKYINGVQLLLLRQSFFDRTVVETLTEGKASKKNSTINSTVT